MLLASCAQAAPAFVMEADEPYAETKVGKVAWATRTRNAPELDGLLEDPCWSLASPVEDFIEFQPIEGATPKEATRVRFLYDDEALYVGFECLDDDPAGIVANSGRRDNPNESDVIYFAFDSRHDHMSSFVFGVTASGTQVDVTLSQDSNDDSSWDSVWRSEVKVGKKGWSGELKLPFTLFRFVSKDQMVWGLEIQRKIPRLHEEILWMPLHRGEPGLVSRSGHLAGLDGIGASRTREWTPYFAASLHSAPGEEEKNLFRAGADFKIGISSHVTLDATVNPDFGQVEADPAELNLTAFETFFPEKRPFFIEGSELFATESSLNIFHSRRIGRQPQRYDVKAGDEVLDWPENTTILGAAKITGKTDAGTTFGLISALTDREYARVLDADGLERKRLVEPLSHYFVGRIAKEQREGRQRIQLMGTSILRENDSASSSFSLGNSWRSASGFQNTSQSIVGSRVMEDGEEIGGLGWNSSFQGGGRNLKFGVWTQHVGPSLEINDLGYLSRNAYRSQGAWAELEAHDPHGSFRSLQANLTLNYDTNWVWDKLENNLHFEAECELMNYWSTGFEIEKQNQHYDDWETWDSDGNQGPMTLRRGNIWAALWMHSPRDRDLFGFWRLILQHNADGGGGYRTGGWLSARLGSRLTCSLSPGWKHVKQDAQFVEEFNGDYVFAELDQRTLDLTTRMNLSFSNRLTLETYMQPFMAWGDYERYRVLAGEGTRDFLASPYGDPGYDFTMESLNLNAVLRWEYRQGSTLYLVWSRSHFDWIEAQQLDFQPWEDLKANFKLEPENTIMLKVSRWFG